MATHKVKSNRPLLLLAFFFFFAALSYISTMYRVAAIGRPQYLYVATEKTHLDVHYKIMDNAADAPYQYRILSELILELFLRGGEWAGIGSLTSMIVFKMSLHFIIFSLAYLFFRQLQLGAGFSLFGVAFIFYAILASYYNEDLNFYQYLDFIFFLAAFILILKKLDFWLVPLTFLAVLNKETAAAIPFVYLLNRLELPGKLPWKNPKELLASIFEKTASSRKTLLYFAAMFAAALGVYAGLRLYFGTEREYVTTAMLGPGWKLIVGNLFHKSFYINWLVFFNFLLFTPWPQWSQKPAFIKRTAAVLFPLLILGNLIFGTMAEVRVFFCLLPLLLVAGLINFERWTQEGKPSARIRPNG